MREEAERIWIWRDAFQNMRVAKAKPAGESSTEYVRVDRTGHGERQHRELPPSPDRNMSVIADRAARPKVTKAAAKKISVTPAAKRKAAVRR